MSKIEWTEKTWNPIVGCSIVSPGCTNCYAMRMAARIEAINVAKTAASHYFGTTQPSKAGAVWTGKVALAPEKVLLEPLRRRKPTLWFVNSMGDLFHESIPDEWIDQVFAVMALCPQHTFQVLTKRAERMREYCSDPATPGRVWRGVNEIDATDIRLPRLDGSATLAALCAHGASWGGERPWPFRNVWLGVSAERQQEADERLPWLINTPAAVRFVSYEPALGPLLLQHDDLRYGKVRNWLGSGGINWVICGGESGPGARPMHPQWARDIRDQCKAAGVAFFFKQWGTWGCDEGPPSSGYDRIMEGRARCAWWNGAAWKIEESGYSVDLDAAKDSGEWVFHLGKKAAGRTLDGVIHDAMPEARA